MDFEIRLLKHEFKLNDTDDIIADYVKKNRNLIHSISIQKISADLFIAPNAIMRFAKKLEYNGFSDMKFSILRENENLINIKNVDTENLSKTILKTNQLFDQPILDDLSTKIINSKNCIILGLGDNLYFCEMMSKYLRSVKIRSDFFPHLHEMLFAIKNCCEDDLIIIISVSGEKERLINLAEIAKSNNSTVVSLTHFCNNTLSNIAHISLYFWAELEIINGWDITDRSGMMILIRVLIEKIWAKCRV